MSNSLTTPIAIVLGCALIATGLYLGLRTQVPVFPPVPLPPPAPITLTPEDLTRITSETTHALDDRHAVMVAACVPTGHAPVQLRFSLAFSAQGAEMARGISVLDKGDEAVGACLRQKFPPALHIPPPGRGVSVDARMVLP